MQVKYSKLWRVIGIFLHSYTFTCLALKCLSFSLKLQELCEVVLNEGDFEGEERPLVNLVQSPDQKLYLFPTVHHRFWLNQIFW